MDQSSFCPVVEVTRGDIVESLHFGAAAVVDSGGRLVASIGDPSVATFLRSSSKPFQALPFIEMGGAEKFGLTEREIGLICSSHSGTDEHFQTVTDMQKKIGIGETNLMCGTHPPFHGATSRAMILRGETPTPNRHNCSGKHTGMLASASMRGQPLETYLERGSIVQQTILKAFAEMCGVDVGEVELGTDGCSAPVFAVPLRAAALAFARLADPFELAPERAEACRKIWRGMTGNPDMVAGPDRFDTIFMTAMKGRALSKAGAEGYQGLAILPSDGSRGLGIAIKVSDGDLDNRASGVIAVEILRQLGVISNDEAADFGKYAPHPIQNWRKLTVGEIRPCFQLKMF
jgi:L-asparaginase II